MKLIASYAEYVGQFFVAVFPDCVAEPMEIRAPEVVAFVGGLAGRYRPGTVELTAVRREEESVPQPDLGPGPRQWCDAPLGRGEEAECFADASGQLLGHRGGVVFGGQVNAGVPTPVLVRCARAPQPLLTLCCV